MPEPRPHHAALAERNRLLSRTRTLTLGIAGGAALASLALGTAFAHALPGHSYHPPAAQAPVAARSSSPAAQPARHDRSGRRRADRAGRPHRHVRRHHAIAPPTHAPAPAPSSSPPQVTSGGT
jgi:hypothetical protein